MKKRAAAPSPEDRAQADRGAGLLWIALLVLAAARLVLAFTPGTWVWGLSLQRFLDPWMAWLPWMVVALALVPAVARALLPTLERAGDALVRSRRAAIGAALLAAGLVWVNPDDLRFVGDFVLRQGTVEMGGDPARLFPQALPLEVLLHFHLPRALQQAGIASVNQSGRLYGLLDAALLALLGITLARALALRGVAALAAWATVVFGGWLVLFTGYNKSLAELVVLTVAVGVFAVRLSREGRGALPLGLVLAVALALHRSSLALIPAAATAWALSIRRFPGSWKRPTALIGLVLPLIALAIVLPRSVPTLLGYDASVHFAAGAPGGNRLASALAPLRLADFLSLALLLTPLALPALLARPPRAPAPERWVLLALALPLGAAMLLVHPVQGLFRDWDVFAPAAAALGLLAAARIGRVLGAAESRRWVGAAAIAGACLPSLQWLAHQTDVDRGFRRIEAYVSESPRRPDNERGLCWDFIGIRCYRLRRLDEAVQAWERAIEITPARRIFEEWARGEMTRGNLRGAQAVYQRMLARDTTDADGWLELAEVDQHIPDSVDLARVNRILDRLRPEGSMVRSVSEYMLPAPAADTTARRPHAP